MGLDHHKSMKKGFVIGFLLLLLINFSLEFSIGCNSLPESQDNIRDWTLLNNENNSVIIELEESRNVSIQYYIEEIEEIDQMRYIVNLNFTGDVIQLYGNISEDRVKNFTIFYVSVFAGDEANIYYELKILNETIFTIPDYFYNFSWNFTSKDPLQFLNLRFHKAWQVQEIHWESWGSNSISLINDPPFFEKDSFENLIGKINFNINSQQFITNYNISVDFSKENHTEIKINHDEINYGDGSVAGTKFDGALSYMNREQSLIDNGWIPVIYSKYSQMYFLGLPVTEVYGVNNPTSLSIFSNDEISNQTDQLVLSLYINPILKVDSPLYKYDYTQVSLYDLINFELDNILPSTVFFQKYSKILIFVGVILGISGLAILTKLYRKKRNLQ